MGSGRDFDSPEREISVWKKNSSGSHENSGQFCKRHTNFLLHITLKIIKSRYKFNVLFDKFSEWGEYQFIFLFLDLILCLYFACVYACESHVNVCVQRQGWSTAFPKILVTNDYELIYEFWNQNPDPLQEQ